jgi:methylglutamate dehydrogenase subunit D
MAERVSALDGLESNVSFGVGETVAVRICEVPDLVLHQVAAWPATIADVANKVSDAIGAQSAPGHCRASVGNNGTALRIEPLKWLLVGQVSPSLDADTGTHLDLSHSRTHVRISGPEAATLLNRHIPIDLSDKACPVGSVFSTALHHVGVTVWHSEDGFEVFLPRGFALSVWEVLMETGAQFNVG